MHQDPFFSIEQLSPLYEAVQGSEIFSDSKYFVDCVPLIDAATILLQYKKEKNSPGFDLLAFVHNHFRVPDETDSSYRSADKTLPEHLSELWDVLTRTPGNDGGT